MCHTVRVCLNGVAVAAHLQVSGRHLFHAFANMNLLAARLGQRASRLLGARERGGIDTRDIFIGECPRDSVGLGLTERSQACAWKSRIEGAFDVVRSLTMTNK